MLANIEPQIPQRFAQVNGTSHLLTLWMSSLSIRTQKGYYAEILDFFDFITNKRYNLLDMNRQHQKEAISDVIDRYIDLRSLVLNDVLNYSDDLHLRDKRSRQGKKLPGQKLSVSAIRRKLAAVKSLLSYGNKINYLQFNVGVPVKSPKQKSTLNERYLSPEQVLEMIYTAPNLRIKLIIRTLYLTGARAEELIRLTWKDLKPGNNGTGLLTLFGKGEKTRVVAIKQDLYQQLMDWGDSQDSEAPIFSSSKGYKQPMGIGQLHRIVKESAARAGLSDKVSPHWLRHCYASHAVENGAPISLVQRSLGHESLDTTGTYLHHRPEDSAGLYLKG